MSWFFLQYGGDAEPIAPARSDTTFEHRQGALYVVAGGPGMTCISQLNSDGSGFVVCGAGLQDDAKHVQIMQVDDWKRLFKREHINVSVLGGHFACITWDERGLRFFNDALGIREIFYSQGDNAFSLSTHLHLLSARSLNNSLNTSAFGGKWCLYIQADHGSPITEIQRVGPGGSGSYEPARGLNIKREQPLFDYTPIRDTDIEYSIADKIKRFTIFPIMAGTRTKLALSGGVDSRLILAALNDQPRDTWDAFTFGYASDADVRVARLLSKELDFKLQVVEPTAITLKAATDFLIETDLFKPISAAYAHLSFDHLERAIIIDGAPGELLRRRLFTKMEYMGANSVAQHNWDEVAKHLWAEKPNIWNAELADILRRAAVSQVHAVGEALPPSREVGIGNWIDTMFCRTWYANTSGADQRRIDGIMLSTSPFAQPSMLTDVFHASEAYRKSGKLAKGVLHLLSSAVASYPYAKDEVIFPSWTPWYLAKLYGKLAKKRSPVATDQSRFLEEFRSEILDALHSREVRECSFYDQKRLNATVLAYYKGHTEHAAFVEWWYSFELWRSANRVTSWR